ncbi:MAG: hypothetical protein J7641_05120 [Cyanobacteria bacterium SID2]|nr:hypothetical protein [Cyanobacteria bacterium SID2]MBP0006195.1 hypothetical protein [Cyanobacteria bacterium SBC]
MDSKISRSIGDVGGWEKRLGLIVPSVGSIEGIFVGGFKNFEVDGLDWLAACEAALSIEIEVSIYT